MIRRPPDQEQNGAPVLRRFLRWTGAILVTLFALGALEVISRWWLVAWHQEIGSRHMQPYFMTGGYYQTPLPSVPNDTLFLGPGGPETYGYRKAGGTYVFGFDRPVNSVADRGTFLFQDRAALADASPDPNVVRVFALGGSVAYGIGASQTDRRWYAVLERSLSASMNKVVRVVPAGMIGHVSTQERLALELMVLPREPDAIVILDGWNDVALPALFGVRPGDPYDQGMLYEDFYGGFGGSRKWLAQRSYLARYLMHRSIATAVAGQQAALLSSPDRMARYAASTASVYVDNITRMLDRCDQERIPCLAVLQPSRDVAAQEDGEDRTNPLVVASYGRIRDRLREMAARGRVVDLSALLPPPQFVDTVHFGDEGHASVAEAVHAALIGLLRDAHHGPSEASMTPSPTTTNPKRAPAPASAP